MRAEAQAEAQRLAMLEARSERPARPCAVDDSEALERIGPAMNALDRPRPHLRLGIELGFFEGRALVYGGTEPVAIDAQAGKGRAHALPCRQSGLTATAHLTKIITDPKDAELAWICWKTLEREGYRVIFINPDQLHGYPGEHFNIFTRLIELARNPALRPIVCERLRMTARATSSLSIPDAIIAGSDRACARCSVFI